MKNTTLGELCCVALSFLSKHFMDDQSHVYIGIINMGHISSGDKWQVYSTWDGRGVRGLGEDRVSDRRNDGG